MKVLQADAIRRSHRAWTAGHAIAAGLIFQLHLYDDTLIAFLGFDSLKFTKPVKPGDTIHARLKVLEKRETSP